MNMDAAERERQSKILSLTEMGFSFLESQNALISTNFNSERAIAILTSGSTSPGAINVGIPVDEDTDDLERQPLLAQQRRQQIAAQPKSQVQPLVQNASQPTILPDSQAWAMRQKMYQDARRAPRVISLFEPGTGRIVFNIKLFVAVAMVVGFIVAFFASFWVMWVYMNYPECGTSLASARFSVTTSSTYKTAGMKTSTSNDDTYATWSRMLSGNACPGYDWTGQSTPGVAGDDEFEFPMPLVPVNCSEPTEVGLDDPVFGHIGYALNGVAIFSPSDGSSRDAVEYEYETFDGCGGHVKAQSLLINKVFVASNPPGDYHYHAMPGDGSPYSHSSDLNLNFTLCDDVTSWYTESENDHSPLVGFMLDGIPIYGPRGAGGEIPSDFDECGGHASDKAFYHYHFKSTYPYSVDCLWGRTDGLGNGFLDNYDTCQVSATQSNYTDLIGYSLTYGGEGDNKRDTFGCLFLLGFGAVLLVYAALHCLCITCGEWWAGKFSSSGSVEGRPRQVAAPPSTRL